jgi:hypothetical protein
MLRMYLGNRRQSVQDRGAWQRMELTFKRLEFAGDVEVHRRSKSLRLAALKQNQFRGQSSGGPIVEKLQNVAPSFSSFLYANTKKSCAILSHRR